MRHPPLSGARPVLAIAAVLTLGAAWLVLARAQPAGAAAELPLAPVMRLGSDEGDPRRAFGLVADVATDDAGRLFVLDALMNRVAMFTREGRPLGTLGEAGRGPGELALPAAMAVDPAGRVYVLDRLTSRISVFEVEGARPAGTLRIDFGGEDLCLLGGRLYVLGERGGRLIHELDPATGAVVRSFAPDPAARNPLLRSTRSSGYLGCGGDGEILFLPLLLPEVRRYSASTGRLAATLPLPGYRAVRVEDRGDEVVFRAPSGGRHHMASSLAPLGGGRWLVQIGFARQGSRSQHEIESIRSYLLPARGPLREIGGELPRVVAIRSDTAFSAATSPYPNVGIFHLRARGEEE